MSRNGGVNERLLESENNKLSDQLARKISTLKQISIDMKVQQLLLIARRRAFVIVYRCFWGAFNVSRFFFASQFQILLLVFSYLIALINQ